MYCQRITAISVVAVFMVSASAGELNLVKDIQKDFKMGLFARQDQQTLPVITDANVNLNTFNGDLGVPPLPIKFSSNDQRPFLINGETVTQFTDAINKACDGQANLCAQQANGASKGKFEVSDCDSQKAKCRQTLGSATQTAFLRQQTETADSVIFCEI
ncbi:hypothetical protein F5Y19DRAFT_184388 [Xylariaceae sp. FL1651]|nr:hypothetical protein F5Y19DRAFT_184388 [Xylariaceae sp. FL1651]